MAAKLLSITVISHNSKPGGVSEWPMVTVLKTVLGASRARVRIPPPPPFLFQQCIDKHTDGSTIEVTECRIFSKIAIVGGGTMNEGTAPLVNFGYLCPLFIYF